MLTLLRIRLFRNRVIARYLTLVIVIAALVSLPLGLPGTNTARADCWTGVYCPNGAFNVGAMVASIDVCWKGATDGYQIVFHLQPGPTPPPYHQGGSGDLCLAGFAQFIQINGGLCGSGHTDVDNAYQLDVNNTNCGAGSFTVGYRVFAYDQSNNPKKVHGSLTINPSDFTFIGQCITGYAPVPGC